MNELHELLATLAQRNVKLTVEGERLRVAAPSGALTTELHEQLRQHKNAILQLLQTRQAGSQSIPALDHGGSAPLSFAQQRLWFLAQLEGPSATYNLPAAFRLQGVLDVAALQSALDAVIERHAILRTTFDEIDGAPRQLIHTELRVPIDVSDLSRLSAAAQTEATGAICEAAAQAPFDLASGPLLRVQLLRLAADSHVLALTLHHIVADGWSASILLEELCTIYLAAQRGLPAALPPLTIQYADFAVWQQNQSAQLTRQLDYWQQQLQDAPPLLALPTDHPRPALQRFVGEQLPVQIDAALTEELAKFSRQHGVTPHMVLLASYALLLARYSGASDLVIGAPISNRNRPESEPLIGFFVNTLALRCDLSGVPTFAELVQRVKQVTLDGYANQDAPFEQVVERLQPLRNLSHTPIFQVAFNLVNLPATTFDLAGLRVTPLTGESKIAKFDLTLSLNHEESGLSGFWEYNSDLFERATIERLAAHYQRLLQAALHAPTTPIAQISLLSAAEQQQLLVEWRGAAAYYPATSTIQQLFELQAAQRPAATALIFLGEGARGSGEAGATTLTYRELNERANRLAHYLRAQGIGQSAIAGQRVAICCRRSVEMIVGILGILKAGAAYVPLDPDYPGERLRTLINDAQPSLIVAQAALRERLAEMAVPLLPIDSADIVLATQPSNNPNPLTTPDDPIYVIYTSGSTGTPKGVIVPQRGVVNTVYQIGQMVGLNGKDRLLQSAPYTFDASALEFFAPLVNGAALVIHTNPAQLSSAEWLQVCTEQQITATQATVALLQQRIDDLALNGLRMPPTLRVFLTGGEKPALDRLKRWAELGDHEMLYLCSYGPTEAAITTTAFVTTNHAVRHKAPNLLSMGKPLPNTQVLVLDPQQQPVPIGVQGELYIGGVGVANGYLNQPELTAAKFVEDLRFANGEWPATQFVIRNSLLANRFYRSGDLVRWLPSGDLEFLGRIDQQIKIRGFRIELGEIEAQLKTHPLITEAVVTVVELGENDRRLAAYFQATEAQLDSAALHEFLKATLPAHMLPAAYLPVTAWPLTRNGKIDRAALPRPTFAGLTSAALAPRTANEARVAAIWAEVLGLAQVGVESSFFELGGHSLLATQVVARLRSQLGVEVPLRSLFEGATIATLAQLIEQPPTRPLRPPLLPSEQRAALQNDLPLSFAQERLWLLQQLNPESSFFNMPTALRLDGVLEIAALRAAFAALVQRHETLRTHFVVIAGQPRQQVAAKLALDIPLLDVNSWSAAEQAVIVRMLAEDDAKAVFDLSRGPLLRVKVVRLAATAHVLLVNLHHSIGDDWSNRVLLQEFGALYRAQVANLHMRGDQPANLHMRGVQPATLHTSGAQLPPLPVQYGDYAVWQRNWLQGAVLDEQIDYWRAALAGAPPLLELPTDRPRPTQQRFVGRTWISVLDGELLQGLRQLSQQQQATLSMTLLAAFAALLARYSGTDDMVIGVPVAGRSEEALEPLIGCFLNTLALRLQPRSTLSFAELLAQTKQTALAAYAHQDAPIEAVINAVVRQHSLSLNSLGLNSLSANTLSHSPLFQVLFNFLQDRGDLSEGLGLPGLTVTPLAVENTTAKFDLTLAIGEGRDELTLGWEYNSDLFAEGTVVRLARHFEQLVRSALAAPTQPIGGLALLAADERRQLLVDFNEGEDKTHAIKSSAPVDQVFHQLFEAQAERTPEALAVVCGTETISYRQLNEQANHWAWQLAMKALLPDGIVVPFLERGLDFARTILAIFKVGSAYLPIDPKTPTARIAVILQQSRAGWIVTNRTLLPVVEASLAQWPADEPATHLRPQIVLIEDLGSAATLTSNLPARAKPDNLAYVIFTSGSTGVPKGAMVEQRGLVNHLHAMRHNLGLDANDVIAQTATQSYVISVWQFLAALLTGGRVEIVPDEVAMEPAALLGWLAERNVTILQIVPSLLRLLLDEVARQPQSLASLRWLIPTGEALPPALARRWFDLCPQIPLLNAYGSSECSDDVAHAVINAPPAPEVINMPVGRPIANVHMYVLDQFMQPTPIGVAGELYVGGYGVGRGYLHDTERTAAAFLPNPFDDTTPGRLYKTGDKARYGFTDGDDLPMIEVLGRLDFQVKVRGFRVELGEIEATLGKHPALAQAVVVARSDSRGETQLVGYVVPRADKETRRHGDKEGRALEGAESTLSPTTLSPTTLRTFLAQQLPDYMIPALIVVLDQLPLNANGKVDRKVLVTQATTAIAGAGSEQKYVAPRNAIEAQLTPMLADVLGLETGKLGVNHSFFDLGGHSLLAVQVLAQLRQGFGVDLPLRQLFEHATVAGMADLVLEAQLRSLGEDEVAQLLREVQAG